MPYLLLAVEGVLTFLSPCLLPMIPIYVAYLAGKNSAQPSKYYLFRQSVLFVLGFSIIFMAMNTLVSSIGIFFLQYRRAMTFIIGCWLILLGIDFWQQNALLGCFMQGSKKAMTNKGAFVFGMLFAISWTPCVGVFLASALAQAATAESLMQSMVMLSCFCLGLGIPFILTAVLLDEMRQSLKQLTQFTPIIQKVSAVLLIGIGVTMLLGWYDYLIMLGGSL
ncbi:MAG: cytochrome c biogenesis protein CcdA [Aerococcaceae bacterium]|nr:cytochrome c biogenesis protein CcdA [Aerococcaceae bacterium]